MKTMIGGGNNLQQTAAKRILFIVLATALILMVPLVAMQFTDEVAWDLFDFAAAGALLVGTGLLYEIAARKVSHKRSRAVIGAVLALALLLVWAELAVGIIGDQGLTWSPPASSGGHP